MGGEESWSAARIDHAPVPVMPDTGPFTFLLRASVSSSEEGGGGAEPSPSCFQFSKFWEPPIGRLRWLACRAEGLPLGALAGWESTQGARVHACRIASLYQRFFFFLLLPLQLPQLRKSSEVMESWGCAPSQARAGWQPKPELGFDFIFSFSG